MSDLSIFLRHNQGALTMGQNILTALMQGLSTAGVTGTTATSVLSSVAGSLAGSVSSQVNADLNQLMALVNNPAALMATGGAIVTKIESINGLPTSVLPLLENLRLACATPPEDPLKIAQLISAVEQIVNAQTSIF